MILHRDAIQDEARRLTAEQDDALEHLFASIPTTFDTDPEESDR